MSRNGGNRRAAVAAKFLGPIVAILVFILFFSMGPAVALPGMIASGVPHGLILGRWGQNEGYGYLDTFLAAFLWYFVALLAMMAILYSFSPPSGNDMGGLYVLLFPIGLFGGGFGVAIGVGFGHGGPYEEDPRDEEDSDRD